MPEHIADEYRSLYGSFDTKVENLVKCFGEAALLDVDLQNGQKLHLQRWDSNDWWMMVTTSEPNGKIARQLIFDRSYDSRAAREQLKTGIKYPDDAEWSASFSQFRSGRFSEIDGLGTQQLLDAISATALVLSIR